MKRQSEKILISGEKACVIQPSLAKLLGRSAAHILQHIHYALQNETMGKYHNGQKWVYNTYTSWQESIQIYSEITIRRAISKLESMGILLSQTLSTKKSDRTKWYTLNYENINTHAKDPQKRTDDTINLSTPSDQNEQILIEQRNPSKIHLINQTTSYKNETTVKELFETWTTIVAKDTEISLTKKRAQHLMAALKLKFNGCIHQWKHFCERVASSDFLMGRVKTTFKASLDWVLKFDIIQRILEGDFGVQSTCAAQNEPPKPEIDPKTLGADHQKLLQCFGLAAYRSWFSDCKILTLDGQPVLQSKSGFWKDSITTRFGRDLDRLGIGIV